jgi:hypothetical protein
MNGLSCVVNLQSIHSVQFPMCPDCTSARQLCLIIDRRHCPGANSARTQVVKYAPWIIDKKDLMLPQVQREVQAAR